MFIEVQSKAGLMFFDAMSLTLTLFLHGVLQKEYYSSMNY